MGASQTDSTQVSTNYYRQTTAALSEVAYSNVGSGIVLPRPAPDDQQPPKVTAWGTPDLSLPYLLTHHLATGTPAHHDTAVDGIILREDPRVVYRLPLETGKTWTSFKSPFLQTREVVGKQTVWVNGRAFECYAIRVRVPKYDPDLEWFEYVNGTGLVLREVRQEIDWRDETGAFVGTATFHDRIELISVSG